MKRIVALIFFISQWCYSGTTPEISILTCSPGDEVYSVFGHSAIRIVDKEQSVDLVYNFGMFDFDTPHFTFKFVRGRLTYYLGIQKTEDFIWQYTAENRLVSEQNLNLTYKEKEELIARLHFLYRPENRTYLYSFLEKNCSTEIRDLLMGLGVDFSDQEIVESNRQLINSHLEKKPWLRFGTNLMLGSSLDRNSSHYQSTFLPIHLKEEIGKSYLNGRPLVKSEQVLNTVEKENKIGLQKWISPMAIFSLLFIIFIFWFPKPVELLVCLLIGGTGLVLSLMWLFSEHPEVRNNLNILWCNPLYLFYIPIILKNKTSIFLASVLSISILGTFFIWLFNLQSFDIAVMPLLLILGLINFRQISPTTRGFKVSDRQPTKDH